MKKYYLIIVNGVLTIGIYFLITRLFYLVMRLFYLAIGSNVPKYRANNVCMLVFFLKTNFCVRNGRFKSEDEIFIPYGNAYTVGDLGYKY